MTSSFKILFFSYILQSSRLCDTTV